MIIPYQNPLIGLNSCSGKNMILKTHVYRIALLSFILGMAGCSSTMKAPIEDRNSVPPRVEQQPKPADNNGAVAIPLSDDMMDQPSNSQQGAQTEPLSPAFNAEGIPVSPSTNSSRPAQQNTAVAGLLSEATNYSEQGDLRSAQTSLQRAQRIAPRDPEVYYALANTHLTLQDYGLAEQVALKGVSLVQGQAGQLNRFWSLIATIRTAAGNTSGAQQARDTANRY
jgi:tetratricopeptide (TPR) repeat protein